MAAGDRPSGCHLEQAKLERGESRFQEGPVLRNQLIVLEKPRRTGRNGGGSDSKRLELLGRDYGVHLPFTR